MFSATDVRSAANTFKITKVIITYENNLSTAKLELDQPGSELDVFLARTAVRDVWK